MASISAYIQVKTSLNSIVFEQKFLKMLAGFGFQNKEIPGLFFYKYTMNFPKLFLIKNVEKIGKAIRASLSIAYPHCVNI